MSNTLIDSFREHFCYSDGQLIWIKKSSNNSPISVGDVAGCPDGYGYLKVMLFGVSYQVHKIIYAIVYDDYPDIVDHVDTDRSNNECSNLRKADHSKNAMNRSKASGTSSKYKGVSWHKKNSKWQASVETRISGKRKNIYLGQFEIEEDAAKAYDEKAKELFRDFSKLNFPVSEV